MIPTLFVAGVVAAFGHLAILSVPSPRAELPALLRAELPTTPRGENADRDSSDDSAAPQHARGQAEAAFRAGELAYGSGDYAGAIGYFGQAQQLLPHPHTAYNLGLALAHAGRALEAWRVFDELTRDSADPQQRDDARVQRDQLDRMLATIRVDSANPLVCLDGSRLASGTTRRVEPGQHTAQIGGEYRQLQVTAGQAMYLDIRHDRPVRSDDTWTLPLTVTAALTATGATTTAIAGVLVQNPRTRKRLQISAGALAGTTALVAITALALHARADKRYADAKSRLPYGCTPLRR